MKSGMTVVDQPVRGGDEDAAMEPAHEERDDQMTRDELLARIRAAMEPAHEERDDPTNAVDTVLLKGTPQWSPLMKSGMTTRLLHLPDAQRSRNGARS